MAEEPVLSVRDLVKQFGGRGKPLHTAVRGVSFSLARGRFLAIAGSSGSGKSTLARCIAGFEAPTGGTVHRTGSVQLIFQQPAASLNPAFTAADILAEPQWIQGFRDRKQLAGRGAAAVRMVGLPDSILARRAHQMSGGEKQRLAIARALAAQPDLLILDESFAGLDLSVQGLVAALLTDLREKRGLSCILISHDPCFAGRLADEIAVMDQGAIVEHRPSAALLSSPEHPKTRQLLEAATALNLPGAGL